MSVRFALTSALALSLTLPLAPEASGQKIGRAAKAREGQKAHKAKTKLYRTSPPPRGGRAHRARYRMDAEARKQLGRRWRTPGFRPTGSRGSLTSSERKKIGYRNKKGAKRHPNLRYGVKLGKVRYSRLARALDVLGPGHGRNPKQLREGFDNYRAVLKRSRDIARQSGGTARFSVATKAHGLVIPRIDIVAKGKKAKRRPRIVITAGSHPGTEKSPIQAALQFAEKAAADPRIARNYDITVIPLLNPSGLVLGQRKTAHKNAEGEYIDVNRAFEKGQWIPEARWLAGFLHKHKPDAFFDLHAAGSTGRDGHFLLRMKDAKDGNMDLRILSAMKDKQLMDVDRGRGRPVDVGKTYKFDALGSGYSDPKKRITKGTPAKDYAYKKAGVRYSYSFEAPSRIEPKRQVDGLVRMLGSGLHHIRARH